MCLLKILLCCYCLWSRNCDFLFLPTGANIRLRPNHCALAGSILRKHKRHSDAATAYGSEPKSPTADLFSLRKDLTVQDPALSNKWSTPTRLDGECGPLTGETVSGSFVWLLLTRLSLHSGLWSVCAIYIHVLPAFVRSFFLIHWCDTLLVYQGLLRSDPEKPGFLNFNMSVKIAQSSGFLFTRVPCR